MSSYQKRKDGAWKRFVKKNKDISEDKLKDIAEYDSNKHTFFIPVEAEHAVVATPTARKKSSPPPAVSSDQPALRSNTPALRPEQLRLPISTSDKPMTVFEILKTCEFNPIFELVNIYNSTSDTSLKFKIAKEILPFAYPKTSADQAGYSTNTPISLNINLGSGASNCSPTVSEKIIDVINLNSEER